MYWLFMRQVTKGFACFAYFRLLEEPGAEKYNFHPFVFLPLLNRDSMNNAYLNCVWVLTEKKKKKKEGLLCRVHLLDQYYTQMCRVISKAQQSQLAPSQHCPPVNKL